ncbi:MAG TPA: sigma 54-interacting transcriptional regulator [Vicinamibacterales bacterium]|nr:sigma 54-interacting transcriptional regulator [Vicinamibacterales bacterium]
MVEVAATGPFPFANREIVSASPGMRAALDALAEAAATRAGVLFYGESGTGRQLLAREMHRLAGVPGPFVSVDCDDGTVGELEEALFGTVSVTPRSSHDHRVPERVGRGRLLEARGGTLFLAHLADMPTRVQARLARVLRDGEVLIGDGPVAEPLTVRAAASAGPGWDEAVEEGRIRPDLFKRTAVFRVDVPPLRDRREDVPRLSALLLGLECERRGFAPKTFNDAALSLLAALPWKLNVRELQAVITTLVTRVPRDTIRVDDVLECVRLEGMAPPMAAVGTLREARVRFEREYILAVLENHRWRVADAARTLGIQRTNLYRKMRELRIPPRPGANEI